MKKSQVHSFFYFWQLKAVKVGNLSVSTTEKDIRDFFSFSGDIHYVEMQRSDNLLCIYLYSFLWVLVLKILRLA